MTQFRDKLGEQKTRELHEAFWEAMNSEGEAFIMVYDSSRGRVCDAYVDMTDRKVHEVVGQAVASAVAYGEVGHVGLQ
jgi:hypothetical protein